MKITASTQFNPYFISVKPELTMEGPDLMLLNLTKTEEIICISTAKDWESVEWKKDNCVIKKEKRKHNQQENELEGQSRFSYKIENAKQTDAGRYTCKVETTMGTVLEASKSIGKTLTLMITLLNLFAKERERERRLNISFIFPISIFAYIQI